MNTATNNTTEGSGSLPNSCHTFDAKQIRSFIIVYASESFAAAIACLIAVVVIVSLKLYRKFAHRLLLYVLIVAFLQAVSTGLQVAPIHHNGVDVQVKHGLDGLCAAAGFFVQLTVSQLILVLAWILTYLFLLIVCKYPANSKKQEIAGLVITLGLPLLVTWLPFKHNLYGQAGAWCWIMVTNADCGHLIVEGVVYQLLLFYGPQVILVLLSFVVFVIVAVTLAIQSCKHSRDGAHYQISPNQQAIKEAVPLLLYPILYNVIVGVMFANRINYAISIAHDHNPYYPLFLAHAVCDPLHALFLPLAFLLHPGTVRKLLGRDRPKKRSEDSETNYPVPPESFSDAEPLIIRGTADIYAGGRYKGLFDVDPDTP